MKTFVILASCFASVLVHCSTSSPCVGVERPDILFINADNWAWPHAGCYGEPEVRTPNFDKLAKEGVLFENAFCCVPSCMPARSVLLTGRPAHQLEAGASLWGALDAKYAIYTDMLEQAGYAVGFSGKGWSPGSLEASHRTRNPAGEQFQSFGEFLSRLPAERPFCYWHGDINTARHHILPGAGRKAGFDPAKVRVPACLPDAPEVREDIADYFEAVERWDRALGELLATLETSGRAADTFVLAVSDNGWQFPRGLANVYDTGTHVPMVVRWPGHAKAGFRTDEFIDFLDFAPTFLELAGLKPTAEMTGRSLLPIMKGVREQRRAAGFAERDRSRDHVFLERERHADVRAGHVGYPCRAVRTRRFLYICNFEPRRNPAGDPLLWFAVGPYGDVDPGPSKDFVLAHADGDLRRYFALNFARRPAEELYDLTIDPEQITNVADEARYAEAKRELQTMLRAWMIETGDPREGNEHDDRWDGYPYYGKRKPGAAAPPAPWETEPALPKK